MTAVWKEEPSATCTCLAFICAAGFPVGSVQNMYNYFLRITETCLNAKGAKFIFQTIEQGGIHFVLRQV